MPWSPLNSFHTTLLVTRSDRIESNRICACLLLRFSLSHSHILAYGAFPFFLHILFVRVPSDKINSIRKYSDLKECFFFSVRSFVRECSFASFARFHYFPSSFILQNNNKRYSYAALLSFYRDAINKRTNGKEVFFLLSFSLISSLVRLFAWFIEENLETHFEWYRKRERHGESYHHHHLFIPMLFESVAWSHKF